MDRLKLGSTGLDTSQERSYRDMGSGVDGRD
jgi:hypothetical protein